MAAKNYSFDTFSLLIFFFKLKDLIELIELNLDPRINNLKSQSREHVWYIWQFQYIEAVAS